MKDLGKCSVDGCDRRAKYSGTGWCQTHYHRWWRTGDHQVVRTGAYQDPYRLSYRSVHTRVHRMFGAATDFPCVFCGYPAKEWAYDGTDPTEKTEMIAGKWPVSFSVHPEFYMPTCFPCHRAFDAGKRAPLRTKCAHGHEMTPENTYERPSRPGTRECKQCKRDEWVRRSARKSKNPPAPAVLIGMDR